MKSFQIVFSLMTLFMCLPAHAERLKEGPEVVLARTIESGEIIFRARCSRGIAADVKLRCSVEQTKNGILVDRAEINPQSLKDSLKEILNVLKASRKPDRELSPPNAEGTYFRYAVSDGKYSARGSLVHGLESTKGTPEWKAEAEVLAMEAMFESMLFTQRLKRQKASRRAG